jgi:hypothetical protein
MKLLKNWKLPGGVKILFMRGWVLILISLTPQATSAQDNVVEVPRFDDHLVPESFAGTPASPIFATPEQRRYRTRIRNGVLMGSDAWIGSSRNFEKSNRPNFAGHYFIIRWGCGSQCVMMATVDAKTGIIYGPPLAGEGSELYVPLDNLSKMEVDFRPNSSLVILRNACRDFKNRLSCGRYYFNWTENQFSLIKFIADDPLSSEKR